MQARIDPLPASAAALWRAFLHASGTPADASGRLYDVMRVGDTAASADAGARLILAGVKTATSSLPGEYGAGRDPPAAGSFSIVLDGRDRAVCIIETLGVEPRPFREIDAAFARDYGEWDRTLATWRRECGAYYATLAGRLGLLWSQDTPLLCERFRLVFAAPGSDGRP